MIQDMLLCLILLFMSSTGNAGYTLNVKVHSYNSIGNKCPMCLEFASPGCCDRFSNTRFCIGQDNCDNTFYYCLRPFGTTSPLNVTHPERCGNFDRFGVLSGVNRDSAEIDFSASNVLGLPNPIPLRGLTLSWQPVQLYVEVTDADYTSTDEFVDRFQINIDQIPIGVETSPQQYNGSFGFSSITLSFKVECFIANFLPLCVTANCRDHGNCTCFPGYTGDDCDVNIDDCLGVTCPVNSMCVDGLNTHTCECLAGYSGDNCTLRGGNDCVGVDCGSNGRCVDDINNYRCMCEPGYTGKFCETIIGSGGPQSASKPLVILCVVAVLLVTLAVTIITAFQFVLIMNKNKKPLSENRDPDNKGDTHITSYNTTPSSIHSKIVSQSLDNNSNPPKPARNSEGISAMITTQNNDHNYLAGNNHIRHDTTADGYGKSPLDAMTMTQNDVYNCLVGHDNARRDTSNHPTAPTPEPEMFTSTIANTHQLKPRYFKKLDIYDDEIHIQPSERGVAHSLSSLSEGQEEILSGSDILTSGYNHPCEHSMIRKDPPAGDSLTMHPHKHGQALPADNIPTRQNPGPRKHNTVGQALPANNIPTRQNPGPRKHNTVGQEPQAENIPTTQNPSYNCPHGVNTVGQDTPADDIPTWENPSYNCPHGVNTVGQDPPADDIPTWENPGYNCPREHNTVGQDPPADDIPTWENPGYNCPREHMVEQDPLSLAHHQHSTAPTPEHVVFISTWQKIQGSEDGVGESRGTMATNGSVLTMNVGLTETPV